LQEVFLENDENLAPFHFVGVFDGNDVLVNGVLLNVGHDVLVVRKDPLDGALIQELLDGPFFGVVSHVIVVDTVLTQTSFSFYWFCCPGLQLSCEDS
jgi:hypothetical protein